MTPETEPRWTPYDAEREAIFVAHDQGEDISRSRLRNLEIYQSGYRKALASAPTFPNVRRLKDRIKTLRIALADAKDSLRIDGMTEPDEDARLENELILMGQEIEEYEKENDGGATGSVPTDG